jgi:hypothetical protein
VRHRSLFRKIEHVADLLTEEFARGVEFAGLYEFVEPADSSQDLFLCLEEMFRNNAGHFYDTLLFRTDRQSQELRHAPRQWRRASGSASKPKTRLGWVGLIPNLFGNHPAFIRELLHGRKV